MGEALTDNFLILDRDNTEPRRYQTFVVVGVVLFGSLTAITGKSQLEWCCEMPGGTIRRFERPWFLTATHFFGMSMCIIPYAVGKLIKKIHLHTKRNSMPEGSFLSNNQEIVVEGLSYRMHLRLLLLSFVELFAMLLTGVGLLWTTASVYMALRSSLSLFSALISVTVFKRRLFLFHWFGLGILLVALLVLSASSIVEHIRDSGNLCVGEVEATKEHLVLQGVLGISFVFLGQVVSAGQYALEEVLHCDTNVAPLRLVALQGFWGLLCVIIIVPVLNFTPYCGETDVCRLSVFWHEDAYATYTMLKSNPHLASLSAVYVVSVVLSNTCVVRATRFLGSSKRTAVEISRVILVWTCDLALFYIGGTFYSRIKFETAAEQWQLLSWVQLVGVALLILGIVIFNHVVKLPGLWYPSKWSMAEWTEKGTVVGEASVDPIWRRSDKRDSDSIRRGFYTRIGIKTSSKRVTFLPGYTVIPDTLQQQQIPNKVGSINAVEADSSNC